MQPSRATVEPVVARGMAVLYRRVRNLVISKREAAGNAGPTYFVKTSAKEVYQFGEEEHLLCQLLDGKRSFADIQAEFKRQIGSDLSREQFDGFLNEMLECEIVEPVLAEQIATGKLVDEEVKPIDEPKPAKVEIPAEFDDLAADFEEPAPPIVRGRVAVRLFDPAGALQAVDLLGGPLRFYRWMVLPLAFACLIETALGTAAMGADLSRLSPAHALASAALALLVIGLVPAVTQAATASFLGCPPRVCGLGFRGFIVPRLRFSDAAWGDLRGAEALRVAGATLTARLAVFVAGTGLWLATGESGDWKPTAAMIIGQVALCACVSGARPFGTTPGRKWLTTLFNRSELWRSGGSHRAHVMALSGLWSLACAGLSLLYVSVAVHAGALSAGWRPLLDPVVLPLLVHLPADLVALAHRVALTIAALGPHLAGMATALDQVVLPLLTVVPVLSWLWLRATVKNQGLVRVAYLPEDDAASAPSPSAVSTSALPPSARAPAGTAGSVVPLNRDMVPGPVSPRRRQVTETVKRWPSTSLVFFAVVVALCLAFGFVPYPYEAGGNFTILPHDSSKLNARIMGELTEVLVNEGDKVVPGQILGILSDWDEQANLDVSKAQLENAKANLQALYETPKPEDAELARKQYELAVSKLAYDKAQYDRASVLVKTDSVSRSSYDQTLSQYQQDQAAADVARANYDDVRAGPTPAQFDAARALLRQDAATVAYNEDQLERTRIRATSAGEVVTPNPMLLRGQWFAQGALVFTVQDLGAVQADVQVPETDIGNVQLGGVTRLRPWGYPETTFLGQAVAIAGDAQPDPGGSGTNIIRVRTEVPNSDGALHPTMTGYAKITGGYMPAWKACMQMIVRFFLVQIWSFIP